MDNIKVGSIFYDIRNKVFCTVRAIEMMCGNKYIHYVKIEYDDFRKPSVYMSDYSLADKTQYLPVRSEEEKLVIRLKYEC